MIPGVVASQITSVPGATSWVLSSGLYDMSVSAGNSGARCRSSSAILTWLTTNYPPGNYQIGYKIQVTHTGYQDDVVLMCSSFVYIAN